MLCSTSDNKLPGEFYASLMESPISNFLLGWVQQVDTQPYGYRMENNLDALLRGDNTGHTEHQETFVTWCCNPSQPFFCGLGGVCSVFLRTQVYTLRGERTGFARTGSRGAGCWCCRGCRWFAVAVVCFIKTRTLQYKSAFR